MLLKDSVAYVDFDNAALKPATSQKDQAGSSSASSGLSLPSNSERMCVHVVAEMAQVRAAVARMVFAAGHHAEVYTDASEVIGHRPASGVILVEEVENGGTVTVCRALANAGLWLPVIGFGEQVSADRIVAGMKAGAMDFLVGPMSVSAILEKLKECAKEAKAISEDLHRKANAKSLVARLSAREREVLDFMVTGLSNKEMAREMGLSPRTVEIHRMKMMGKLSASSSAHAVRIRIDTLDARVL